MPIQNVGTLLENVVVVEAATLLASLCRTSGLPLEFVNAFAMPPQTPWIPSKQSHGFDDDALDNVNSTGSPSGYAALLAANLRTNRRVGPNAALLVLGALREMNGRCRMWLNDIDDGCYGKVAGELRRVSEIADRIYGAAESDRVDAFAISTAPYPDSIDDAAAVFDNWTKRGPAGARLAFLDPMSYSVDRRAAMGTSRADHRAWLARIRSNTPLIALHFSSDSRHERHDAVLRALHEDSMVSGYIVSLAFKRQNYSVSCAVGELPLDAAVSLAHELAARVCAAWRDWCERFTRLPNRDLTHYYNGTCIGRGDAAQLGH